MADDAASAITFAVSISEGATAGEATMGAWPLRPRRSSRSAVQRHGVAKVAPYGRPAAGSCASLPKSPRRLRTLGLLAGDGCAISGESVRLRRLRRGARPHELRLIVAASLGIVVPLGVVINPVVPFRVVIDPDTTAAT